MSKSSRSMIYCCRQKDGDCEWAERTISHSHGEIHSHMYNETVIVAKKRDPGILDPELFLAQIRKVEARLGKLAKIRKVETD